MNRNIIKYIKIVSVLIMAWCLVQTASASGLFYDGNVTAESINANIVIDTNALISVEYTLVNEGDEDENIVLGFNGKNETVFIKQKEKKTINLTYTATVDGDVTKIFSFNPILTFNGKPNSKRVNTIFSEIVLPSGIQKIIWTNKNYASKGVNTNGRVYYSWADSDIYPTTVIVKWSTLDVDLNIIKDASPQEIKLPNQTISIKIIIENKGGKEVNNITLTDDYVPSEFEAIEPIDEFFMSGGNTSDPRLFWKKNIDKLSPNEVKNITYSIKYIGDISQIYNFELKPCVLLVNGNLIGVSNEVTISRMVGVGAGKEKTETPEFPITYLIIIIVIIVIGLIIVLFKSKRIK